MLGTAAIMLVVVAGAGTVIGAGAPGGTAAAGSSPEQAALARVPRAFADNALVLAWGERAAEVAATEKEALPFKGVRAFALMHLAMHDALNAVAPVYRPYAFQGQDPAAHPLAAAAQAAHDVLLAQYPGAAGALKDELQRSLAGIPGGQPRARGKALGQRAAAAILARRRADGWDHEGKYSFSSKAGAYQSTAGPNGFVLQPGFRGARPIALERADRLRPPPPPLLTSPAYAAAYDEVKAQGRLDSRVRSADQTGYAVWWMEFCETSFNRLARKLARDEGTHAWSAARLIALLNVGFYDGYIAVWDAKFAHDHWRPYTAIRNGGDDGNLATEPDPAWQSLRPAPPFPDYPSAHATACSISAEVLGRLLGDRPFTMDSTTAPPGMPTRRFVGFAAAADECADSRVQLGYHFRYATDAARALGRKVATEVLARQLLPR
jgi:hypothetical protein